MSFRGTRNVRHSCRHSLPGDQASSSALLAYSVRDSIGIPRVRVVCVHSHACSIRSPRIRRTRHRKHRPPASTNSPGFRRVIHIPSEDLNPATVYLRGSDRQKRRERIFRRAWYYGYFFLEKTNRKGEKGFLKELDTFQKPRTSEEVTDEINVVDIFQKSRIIHFWKCDR